MDILKATPSNVKYLSQLAQAGFRVMMIGPHGVGKTEIAIHVLRDMCGYKLETINGSTFDPMNLLGIPYLTGGIAPEQAMLKAVEMLITKGELPKAADIKDEKEVIFAPPKYLTEVEAFFIDEANRTQTPNAKHALMELINHFSVNGWRLPNLKVDDKEKDR